VPKVPMLYTDTVLRSCAWLRSKYWYAPFMSNPLKPQFQAFAFAVGPIIAMLPVLRSAGFGLQGFTTIWPILLFMPLAMWMESRSLTLLLSTCRGRRDLFAIAAIPVGAAALVSYVFSAAVFAFTLPNLLRMLL
jgi:hypothetical protein